MLRALQCVAVCCSVLQYVAMCCSVLQCVAGIQGMDTVYGYANILTDIRGTGDKNRM